MRNNCPLLTALIYIIFMAIATLPSRTLFAESSPPSPISVDAAMDKTHITVGDVVTFSVTIRADQDIQSSLPDFNEHFKGFDLIDNGVKEPLKKDGQLDSVYWFQLRADLPGTYTIPPLPLSFTVPDPKNSEHSIQGQTLTPGVIVEVKSILHLQGEPGDIRDIKSILELSGGWLNYLLTFLVVLALSGLVFWLWRHRRPASPEGQAQSASTSLPPHEFALKELQVLKTKGLLEKGKYREHYFELSEIFRRYIGSCFSVPALDWTLEEITFKLKERMNSQLWQQARSVLEYSDLVKFAKSTPSFSDSVQMMDTTISFIQATRPTKEVNIQQT
ncbi:MAG: BatD family protein [Nitrospinota bacterium]|nr:BatD family protein [Nitrospinota bacterium]